MNRRLAVAAPAALILAVMLLAGCAPETDAGTDGGSDASPTPGGTASPTATPDEATTGSAEAGGAPPVADGPVVSTTVIPRDCSGIVGTSAAETLDDIPLNDPSFGESGLREDGSLRCVWADPGADTSKLVTTISRAERNPVIDFFNELTDIGFTCYEPDAGVRCEKTWENERFPVTDGRTLYFRDGVLIDTQFSHLAPAGFTGGVVSSLWPAGASTPEATTPAG